MAKYNGKDVFFSPHIQITPDTSDADATASDIAFGKTAYVNNVKITGTAPTENDIYQEILNTSWG